jgi:DNA-3-methyladenine glycosylase
MIAVGRDFYARDTLIVARELLGQIFCRSVDRKILRAYIVETEAYTQYDPASHAFHGRAKRAEARFQQPGTAYVHFVYGMYHCLNISTERESFGAAVLIRALERLDGLTGTNGPGKLCRAMHIDLACNGCDVTLSDGKIWVKQSHPPLAGDIVQTTRIGITQATEYPWRSYMRNRTFVSVPS